MMPSVWDGCPTQPRNWCSRWRWELLRSILFARPDEFVEFPLSGFFPCAGKSPDCRPAAPPSHIFCRCIRCRCNACMRLRARRLPDYLPENGEDGRLGEPRRITLAVVDFADNMQGEFSADVITDSELNAKKIACTIERVAHDAQHVGIVDTR